ncbi:translation elongation factor Ts [Candidatus Gottesmanbacteria bacterium RIFCSPLOWO2_02_FULL_40_10]|nr:MAG: translation elongation factor Ts [Candidatus Gottesmanbacteria bacterium RIFCSPLOWO2_02_FULL_40_10]
MKITIDRIKKIRELTGYGIMDCRKALEEAAGDEKKAVELLNIWGIEKSAKKKDRETKAGLIQSYIHGEGKIGVLIKLLCETDFVARTDDFKNLAHELCLQISSMNPKDIKELLKQEYIRDTGLTIGDMIKQTIGKLGENITVSRFVRMQLGEK